MPAIEVENLRRVYRTTVGVIRRRAKEVLAVDDLSFEVAAGELFGLLGPNGAGKTTMVKMLTTLLIPTVGTARVMGLDVVRDADTLRGRIGDAQCHVHQQYRLLHVAGVQRRQRPRRRLAQLDAGNLVLPAPDARHRCRRLIIRGASLSEVAPLLIGEVVVGAIYALLGYSLFRWFELQAKRRGTLEAF